MILGLTPSCAVLQLGRESSPRPPGEGRHALYAVLCRLADLLAVPLRAADRMLPRPLEDHQLPADPGRRPWLRAGRFLESARPLAGAPAAGRGLPHGAHRQVA